MTSTVEVVELVEEFMKSVSGQKLVDRDRVLDFGLDLRKALKDLNFDSEEVAND